MKLCEYDGKTVRITTDDGIFEGVAYYTSALDNEPAPESLTIRHLGTLIELFGPEIKSIELR